MTSDDETGEREQLDGDASASAHLSALPSADIGGATRPRGPDEIPYDPDEPGPQIDGKPMDPLGGIPSVPADVIAGVPESQVTDRQGEDVTSGEPRGDNAHPPASSGL